ncbi:DUF4349 domain-containing protein [Streptomyces sp. RerS4]|uniref:DUF4349 domain-containing protein n=1 Tax=Streptomyces sp. RerS4 TaxID=2942449 RepID=UPI00201C81FA|nr:DUF4349 domain-containing protein [Streptomyces sp. RerS4]UQX03600.1 DUF4349 domain-containing protein [Streptomyces sp. RerS4]
MHAFHRRRSAAGLATLALAGVIALTGCAADASPQAGDKAAAAPREAAAEGAAQPGGGAAAAPSTANGKPGQQPAAVRPNVIRTGRLGIETTRPQEVLATARTAAEGAGGYVGNESTERGADGRMTSTLTLRVPGDRFDAVIGALEGGGKLLNRKVEAQDVTEKVADVDSRVKSQQASVARVREMMEKASGLSDVVMLESELSRRQADLESLLAQQNALRDQTSMGTITLSVSEPAPKPEEKKAKEKEPPAFGDALSGGWSVFSTLVRYVVLALAAVLPFALAAVLVVLGFKGYRRLRPAKPKPGPEPVRVPHQAPAPTGAGVEDGEG